MAAASHFSLLRSDRPVREAADAVLAADEEALSDGNAQLGDLVVDLVEGDGAVLDRQRLSETLCPPPGLCEASDLLGRIQLPRLLPLLDQSSCFG